jgi:hypothetical protein
MALPSICVSLAPHARAGNAAGTADMSTDELMDLLGGE